MENEELNLCRLEQIESLTSVSFGNLYRINLYLSTDEKDELNRVKEN